MNAPLAVRTVGDVAVALYGHRANPLQRFTRPNGELVRLDSNSDFERIARSILIQSVYREDSALTLAFARQLEHVFAKVYEAEFAEYKATKLFPVSTEVGPGDLTFNYRMMARVGQAAVIAGGTAKDLPTVSLEAEEWPSPVITLGCTYELNVIEEASASKANIAIQALKGNAAREAIEQLEEDIFALGYAPAGVPGVTSCLGVQAYPKVSAGTWQSQLAAASVASATNLAPMVSASQAIQGDLAALKQRVYTQSLGRHKVTRILLPTNLYGMLASIPQSPAFGGLSLLKFLEGTLGPDVIIEDWAILLNAGSVPGSTMDVSGAGPAFNTRIIAYEYNPEVMQLIQAQTFVQLPPQWTGLACQIPVYSRIGGAMSIRPLGIGYLDGC